ncbi:hypothetical protein VTK73DRAFT_2877 [Phialemonium thermophilum]|uniref:Cleavage/polyadenylation specificity factor A subunit N-terminal domain-containing protein n=1 Tax=Phialemonium thermophilum TaxID=223376 RepID=A0ABR3X2R5_9PEZI
MAFQTNVFRGGEWVTETVDVRAVLKASAPRPLKKQRFLKPPQCGILTKTVVPTQLVHYVLPVRLRSDRNNDVAFIGDYSVQIFELRKDGQLHDVIRKDDFGSRIRNAAVIGSLPDKIKDEVYEESYSSPVKTEEDDAGMDLDPSPEVMAPKGASFPPQLLLLVLECGDSVFLSISTAEDGSIEFVSSRVTSPTEHLVYPGFHLAVDPSSRYMVLGCAERHFVVFELESVDEINKQSRGYGSLRPVRSSCHRSVQGVIHKVAFLYPRPNDPQHVILLLIVVRGGKSRMVTYEWELGDDLRAVFAEEKAGHRMPVENQMPLLLIPLTVQSAFVIISQTETAVCTEALHGSPKFERFDTQDAPPTANYNGRGKPLWTAWARPSRLAGFFKSHDCIYLAREDGIVSYIEADMDSTLTGSLLMDKFDCSISSAFTCLYDQYTDVLVMAGDSGPGAVWKVSKSSIRVPARRPMELLGVLPNSAPTIDCTIASNPSTTRQGVPTSADPMAQRRDQVTKPDRIFATSGRGRKGSVAEYRHGLQARIGLDLEYGTDIRKAWVFPSTIPGSSNGFHLLLSLPNSTGVLHLSRDLSHGTELEPTSAQYDLSSRTLAAISNDGLVIQVTENHIVLVNGLRSSRFSYDVLHDLPSASIVDAAAVDDYIAVSTHTEAGFRIHLLQARNGEELSIDLVHSFPVEGEVTCLSLFRSGLVPRVSLCIGLWYEGRPQILHVPVDHNGLCQEELLYLDEADSIPSESDGDALLPPLEPVASIVCYEEETGPVTLVGTRSGEVIIVSQYQQKRLIHREKLGVTTARIYMIHELGKSPVPIVSCDSNLILLSRHKKTTSKGAAGGFTTRTRIWPVDVGNPMAATPPVDWVSVLKSDLFFEKQDTVPLLLISGSRILLSELHRQPGPVHRHIPVDGTPTRIIYSNHLQCLIVAVNRRDSPTLLFLDPDTGENIGRPTDKDGKDVSVITGLGDPGDRIFGLSEWECKKDNSIWRFILVSTRSGRLMILSTKVEEDTTTVTQRKIRYWVRFKRAGIDWPVYSVVGYDEGIIYCAGQTIVWETLDTVDKKLRTVGSFDLGSPATSLRVLNGKLLALTNRDSLEVIDPPTNSSGEGPKLIHVDPKTRDAVHMIEITGNQAGEPLPSLALISDRYCGVAGLFIPWQVPSKDCEPILEILDLPASIRKFRRGRTRPTWDQGRHKPCYGRMISTVDDSEILGMCLDGSVIHFTLLTLEVWRILRFIQNLALTSPEICPFTYSAVDLGEFDPEPVQSIGDGTMHVDGDILRRCLDKKALERLIRMPSHVSRFTELLDELEDGRHTAGFGVEEDGVRERYFALAYEILDYFLSPVL